MMRPHAPTTRGLPASFVREWPGWVRRGYDELWKRLWTNSVDVPGPLLDRLVAVCRERDLFCVIGVNERESERPGTLYNTIVYLGPSGVLARHRKLTPSQHERVFHGIGARDDLAVVDAAAARRGRRPSRDGPPRRTGRMTISYHRGSRRLRDRFDTRRLADRLDERFLSRPVINDEDRAFIERMDTFFLATADADGRPQCSYKGGHPGLVRVLDEQTAAFPNYDGNGMYLSMGNLLENPTWDCCSSTSSRQGRRGCDSTPGRSGAARPGLEALRVGM